jgi:UDP-N-acetylglucosamine--N-acetylmuramyl-(pentapeptide) pyrophosphoryl-undecaprenol N-acetylglucosamine transferase
MKVALSCGGTGGHIYPALAIAQELENCFFIGGSRLEKTLVPKSGFRFIEISTHAKNPLKILKGFRESMSILHREKPDCLIATGGYVTAPVIAAAFLLRLPIYIQEQNCIPGKVNRLAGLVAKKVFVAYTAAQKYFLPGKTIVTGNPIRQEIAHLHLHPDRNKILVFGGSLSAKSINTAIEPLKSDPVLGSRIIHLDGKNYCHDMQTLYAQSCLVVCRAGATSLAELAALGLPAILIPYPHAAHNHQEINARHFSNEGAAKIILDRDLSSAVLQQAITEIISNQETLHTMAIQMKKLGKPDAAQTIKNLL